MWTNQGFNFLRQGKTFFTRPIISSDKVFLKDGFDELSLRSRFNRFLSFLKNLTDEQLKFYTEVDGTNHVAWGILEVSGGQSRPAGIGRFIRVKEEPDTGEVGLTVVDEYQKMGLGSLLLIIINMEGIRCGLQKLRYHVVESNYGMRKLLEPYHHKIIEVDQGVMVIETDILKYHEELPLQLASHKIYETWKEVYFKMTRLQD